MEPAEEKERQGSNQEMKLNDDHKHDIDGDTQMIEADKEEKDQHEERRQFPSGRSGLWGYGFGIRRRVHGDF
ncbi:hypothetical protein TWF730_003353 [Orbilia blumenaviensis]|uniref:Uncharacterized protein n=1 Tax=Orbilia blumenaviensis TaxID=1796055 RepID=A0AAV9U9H4_9PEZI